MSIFLSFASEDRQYIDSFIREADKNKMWNSNTDFDLKFFFKVQFSLLLQVKQFFLLNPLKTLVILQIHFQNRIY